MYLMNRSKVSSSKKSRAVSTTLKSCNSITSNPEIQHLISKLNEMTEEFPDNWSNPLNLISWSRTKYCPTESENRIKIENRICLNKANCEKVRPRVKSVKREAKSIELPSKETTLPYRAHYEQLRKTYNCRKRNSQDLESEEQPNVDAMASQPVSGRFKFYDKVRKYKRVTSYIEEKLEDRREYQEQKNTKGTVFSNKIFSASSTPKKTMEKASKSMIFAEDESILKIESIVKKWRPASKEDRKFASTDLKRQPELSRKKYSVKKVLLAELLTEPPKIDILSNCDSSPIKGQSWDAK